MNTRAVSPIAGSDRSRYVRAWLAHNRSRVLRTTCLVLLPWAWTALLVPWWMTAVSLVLFAPAVALVVNGMIPRESRRATDSPALADDEILQMRCQQAERLLSDMQQQMSRWSETSEDLGSDLAVAQQAVGEVVHHIEEEVIKIGSSFKDIMRKTGAQMDCALRLLKSEEHGEGAEVEVGRWLSLPDYIRAYEEQLNAVTERMMRFSTVTRVVDEYEQKMRRRMIQVDELLDELRAMARQTSKLALESSVLAGNDSSSAGQSTVVSLTDKIRAISEDTHELTRRIRHILEGIKEQLTATLRAMRTCAEETQREAYQAKIEVAQLNLTMLEKTKEVRAALEQIGGLGKEIRADIGRIIVAMQFQDITQQKLERVHQPVLDRVIQELRTVAEASHAIRDDAVEPQRAQRRTPPAERASASPPATGEGNKVEFF